MGACPEGEGLRAPVIEVVAGTPDADGFELPLMVLVSTRSNWRSVDGRSADTREVN